MLNSRPDLSIIIVNYRSEQYLESCVASLFKYVQGVSFEIIVVNNDEHETLEGFVRKFPEVQKINLQKNIGFGAAHNLGAKKARAEFLLLLNPDTEMIDDKTDLILGKFRKNKKIGIIGPRLVTTERKTQQWCTGQDVTLTRIIKNNFGLIESKKIWESQQEIFVDWVSGTAMFVAKETFEKVGGFDEKFFMYLEDVDLCRRMRAGGFQVLFCPMVSILHKGGKSRVNRIKQKIQYYRSVVYYLKKNIRNV